MNKILVTYATMAGSTAEVAEVVGEELKGCGYAVDVRPVAEVHDLQGYDGVVVGGPMIMGWHRDAQAFLKKNRKALQGKPLAAFVLAMSLTQTTQKSVDGVPVYMDEGLPKPPKQAGKLSFRERWTQLSHYLQPIIKAARPAKPASIGVFNGRMEYGRLKPWAVFFAMVIIQAPAGDQRNWTAIRQWASGLPAAFEISN